MSLENYCASFHYKNEIHKLIYVEAFISSRTI
jgi:hypothetical protein